MEIQNKTQLKAALRQSFGAVVYAVNELSDEVFLAPRAKDAWSPGEILGHLILSTKPVNKAMSMPKLMLKATFGTNNREERTFGQTKTRYYDALAGGIKAPSNFHYEGVAQKGKDYLITSFTKELDKLLHHIDKWEEKDLSKYILPHPAIGKLTIREMLYSTHFHTEHHLTQIKEAVVPK